MASPKPRRMGRSLNRKQMTVGRIKTGLRLESRANKPKERKTEGNAAVANPNARGPPKSSQLMSQASMFSGRTRQATTKVNGYSATDRNSHGPTKALKLPPNVPPMAIQT